MTTAVALTIGVALVTLVTVVAAGLKDTTRGSLEHGIAAGHVVTGADGWSPTDPAVERALARAGAVTGVRQDRGLAFGDKETVNSVGGELLRFDWVEGDDGVPATLGADGAIVDEGWASEHGLELGDRFALTSANGTELDLTVRGIEGSPLLDAMALGPGHDRPRGLRRGVRERSQRAAAVRRGRPRPGRSPPIPTRRSGRPRRTWTTRSKTVDDLLAIFYVLLALAVIVSLFGIVNTLVLATFERTRELGTLRAVGMSRRQVRRMVRHESIITALIGAVTGMALGLALAAGVTAAFADEGLAFAVPAGALIGFTIVAVIAGVLAAVLPARRAARTNVLVALATSDVTPGAQAGGCPADRVGARHGQPDAEHRIVLTWRRRPPRPDPSPRSSSRAGSSASRRSSRRDPRARGGSGTASGWWSRSWPSSFPISTGVPSTSHWYVTVPLPLHSP